MQAQWEPLKYGMHKLIPPSTETVNLSYFFGPGNDSLLVNSVQYPDISVVERCVLLHDFLDKNDQVLEMWSRARGDNLNKRMIFIIAGLVILIAVWPVYRLVKKFRSKKKKQSRKR